MRDDRQPQRLQFTLRSLFVLVFLSACSLWVVRSWPFVTWPTASSIHPGMSEVELRKRLGQPSEELALPDGHRRLIYHGYGRSPGPRYAYTVSPEGLVD